MGCLKRQALTRSMIEPIHNMMYLCVRQRVEGHAFRYILANQAIRVFVESPLPGMIGHADYPTASTVWPIQT